MSQYPANGIFRVWGSASSTCMLSPEASEGSPPPGRIIQHIRQNFINQGFTEVTTPIIGDAAGGAIAKPFLTEAAVYRGHKLVLRIAPELWLKRLVEYRNEGIDDTPNLEFTTCDFYQAYATSRMCLLFGLATHVQKVKETKYTTLSKLDVDFSTPFKRIKFIPALEEAFRESLPDLSNM
ncbi:hypothetical protein BGX38DRAFT_640138 [Terfezia claveryi]|nr:hypothetical protein BGX38DRAFT_640138 [Terfezia claveryi]